MQSASSVGCANGIRPHCIVITLMHAKLEPRYQELTCIIHNAPDLYTSEAAACESVFMHIVVVLDQQLPTDLQQQDT